MEKTPINHSRKSLGIRRSTKKTSGTPISGIKKVGPNQHLKVKDNQLESPKTPSTLLESLKFDSCENVKSSSYKLSLSRTFQNHHKRKKLEFSEKKSHESSENLQLCPESNISCFSSQTNLPSHLSYATMNKDQLKNEIENKIKLLQCVKKHKEKVDDLKNVINTWTSGFQRSFLDLNNKIQSSNKETLLRRFQLSEDLIKYC